VRLVQNGEKDREGTVAEDLFPRVNSLLKAPWQGKKKRPSARHV